MKSIYDLGLMGRTKFMYPIDWNKQKKTFEGHSAIKSYDLETIVKFFREFIEISFHEYFHVDNSIDINLVFISSYKHIQEFK